MAPSSLPSNGASRNPRAVHSCPGSIQRFSTPHWGRVTPFALTRPDQFGPPAMDTNRLPGEAKALVDLQAKMNDANKAAASYWADGPGTETPAGHWALFAAADSRAAAMSLDANVKVFFALGNAVLDASIATWNAKAIQDTVRPPAPSRGPPARSSAALPAPT